MSKPKKTDDDHLKEQKLAEVVIAAEPARAAPMPTLGRTLHYVDEQGHVCPAIVTAVEGDTVHLQCFYTASILPKYGVQEAKGGEQRNAWRWPPRS